MQEARFTLTEGGLSHEAALALMERIDTHMSVYALAVTINETDEKEALWETVAWFDSAAEAQTAGDVLDLMQARIGEVEQRDWVRESLEGLPPVNAGRFFLHGSHDRHLRKIGGISLEIDAGTAFGTGHHGTTKGCLLALHDILKRRRPARIFDLGTGTGVLALAAAAALRRTVLASDIDREAVRVTDLNAKHNHLRPLLKSFHAAGLHAPAIHEGAPYELIFANILAKPLERLATGIAALLAPNGLVILSGLTRDQERWITACYRTRGLVLVKALRLDNWVVLVMCRNVMHRRARTSYRVTTSAARGSGYAESI